jgi:hypothetical protein
MGDEAEPSETGGRVLEYRTPPSRPPVPKAGRGTRIFAGVIAGVILLLYAFGIYMEHRWHGDGLRTAIRGLPGTIVFGSIMGCRAITGLSLWTWTTREARR